MKKEKFEYCIFSAHEGHINKRLSEYEEEGWEVAGDAHVKYHDKPTSAAFIYIPMKRLIKQEEDVLSSLEFLNK